MIFSLSGTAADNFFRPSVFGKDSKSDERDQKNQNDLIPDDPRLRPPDYNRAYPIQEEETKEGPDPDHQDPKSTKFDYPRFTYQKGPNSEIKGDPHKYQPQEDSDSDIEIINID